MILREKIIIELFGCQEKNASCLSHQKCFYIKNWVGWDVEEFLRAGAWFITLKAKSGAWQRRGRTQILDNVQSSWLGLRFQKQYRALFSTVLTWLYVCICQHCVLQDVS